MTDLGVAGTLPATVLDLRTAIMVAVLAAFALSRGRPGDEEEPHNRRVDEDRGGQADADELEAVMKLLGDRAWWAPRWLERLVPDVDLEGGAPRPAAA